MLKNSQQTWYDWESTQKFKAQTIISVSAELILNSQIRIEVALKIWQWFYSLSF